MAEMSSLQHTAQLGTLRAASDCKELCYVWVRQRQNHRDSCDPVRIGYQRSEPRFGSVATVTPLGPRAGHPECTVCANLR